MPTTECRPTARQRVFSFSFPFVKILFFRVIRVLFLPDDSKTQLARTTTDFLRASAPLRESYPVVSHRLT